MTDHQPANRLLAAAAALLLLGFALRTLNLDRQPLSGDEAYSVVVWGGSTVQVLIDEIAVAVTEPHPPLALLSLNGWARLAGDSVVAMRTFAVLASTLTMAVGFALAKRLGGPRTALIALGLLVVNPFHISYGQFARNYALWMALSALTLWALYRTWRSGDARRYLRWLPYIGLAALTGYVFYLEAFMFVAHNLFALTEVIRDRRTLPAWVAVQITLAVALAPWWLRPELFANSASYEPNGGPANPLWALQSFIVGDTLPPPLQPEQIAQNGLGIAGVLSAVLLAAALVVLWRERPRRTATFMTVHALLPVAGLSLLAVVTGRGYFDPRYIASSALPVTLLLALALDSALDAERAMKRSTQAAAAMIGVLCAVGIGAYHLDERFARGPDWPAVTTLLAQQMEHGDPVIINTPDPAPAYYFRRGLGVQPVVIPEERGGPVDAVLGELAAQHDTLWFIPARRSPWDPERAVAAWLRDERLYVSDQWVGQSRIWQYAAFEPQPSAITHEVNAAFDGAAALEGYALTPPPAQWEPGITVYVELFWRPTAQTDEIVNAFVHLWGPPKPDGSIVWAQMDQMPQGGRASMEVWELGTLIRDAYALQLPADMPPADYQIAVGMYSTVTGNRYLTTEGADHVILRTIPLD